MQARHRLPPYPPTPMGRSLTAVDARDHHAPSSVGIAIEPLLPRDPLALADRLARASGGHPLRRHPKVLRTARRAGRRPSGQRHPVGREPGGPAPPSPFIGTPSRYPAYRYRSGGRSGGTRGICRPWRAAPRSRSGRPASVRATVNAADRARGPLRYRHGRRRYRPDDRLPRHLGPARAIGAAETTGRLARRRLPRERDIRRTMDADIRAITDRIHDTPRRCLG